MRSAVTVSTMPMPECPPIIVWRWTLALPNIKKVFAEKPVSGCNVI